MFSIMSFQKPLWRVAFLQKNDDVTEIVFCESLSLFYVVFLHLGSKIPQLVTNPTREVNVIL